MRLIDGDELEEIIQTELKENPHKDGFARVCHRSEHTHFLDVIRRMPTIDLPPNDPLTLEELWEMDGNPVWDPNLSEWGIVDIHGFNGKGCIRYVNNWWHSRGLMRGRFYRRKPEENGL